MGAPVVDVADETFIAADPARVAERFRAPELAREWWPGIELTVARDRGAEGVQWSVRGELTGSAEIWLEPWHDGVIVHWFLRADPVRAGRARSRRGPERLRRDYVVAFKQRVHRLKDELESGRPAGVPRPGR